MSDPFGAMMGAGMSLFGGMLADEKAEDRLNQQLAWQSGTFEQNAALQREFAINGIRWKAEDARNAGLHPLYAIGGAGAAFTPSGATVDFGAASKSNLGAALSEMGQNVSRAAMAKRSPIEEEILTLNREALIARIGVDDAMRQKILAEARLIGQPGQPPATVFGAYGGGKSNDPYASMVGPQTGSSDTNGIPVQQHPLYKDAVELSPDPMTSRDLNLDGQTSGRDHPAMRQFEFPGGFQMLLPATQGGGMPEEIDLGMWPWVLGANIERYGARWMIDAIGYWSGQSPRHRRERGTLESFLRKYFGGQQSVRGKIQQ